MKDIEVLIHDWRNAAENDFPPPEVTEQERQALAIAFLKTQKERGKIHGWPILGMSFKQTEQAEILDERMRVIHSFIDETLEVSGVNATAQVYIQKIIIRLILSL